MPRGLPPGKVVLHPVAIRYFFLGDIEGTLQPALDGFYGTLTDEQKAITEMVRQFADEQIIPNAEHYDHEDCFPEPIVEQMKELGLFGVTIPEEYDGMGLDLSTYAMIVLIAEA